MNYKKVVSVILIIVLLFNNCLLIGFCKTDGLSIDEFDRLLNEMVAENNYVGTSSESTYKFTNRLVVKTNSSDKLNENYGAISSIEGYKGYHVFQYESPLKTEIAYDKFLDDDIIYVVHDFYIDSKPVEYTQTETFEFTSTHLSWNSDVAQVDDAFELIKESGETCEDVTVAILDTGIYAEHEFFDSERLLDSGYARVDDDTNTSYPSLEDDMNHGTHVSGIIYDNTMSCVNLMPFRVFPLWNASMSVIWSAFEKAVDSGVDVINMSLGEQFGEKDIEEEFTPFLDSIENASNNGIVVVAAAGNERYDADRVVPGCASTAITVAATNISNKPDISYSASGDCVDVAAPGTDIYSTVPRLWTWEDELADRTHVYEKTPQSLYKEMTGTSMAAPLVSAAAATLKSICPDMSAAEIQRIIKETAYVPEGWEENCDGKNYGTGIVNFYNMVKAVLEPEYSHKPTIKLNSEGKIEIMTPEGSDSRIYYSLNGSVPTINNHIKYTEPFSISGMNINSIIAVCHENGKFIGEPVTYRTKRFETLKINYKETVSPLNTDASWYSWNEEVATVDNDGNITGVGTGETTVTAILKSGKRVNYVVHVKYSKLQWFIRIFLLGFLWY